VPRAAGESPAARRQSRGVLTVANDAVYNWAAGLLGSLRRTNPHLPVLVVPFDANLRRLSRLLDRLGLDVHQPATSLEAAELVARRCGGDPGIFRRLVAFDGPFDLTLYLDADTVVLRSLDPLFDAVAASGLDVAFGGAKDAPRPGRHYHFLPGPFLDRYLARGGRLWNAGVIMAASGRHGTEAMARFAEQLGEVRSSFAPRCEDQSFICHYLLETQARAATLSEVSGASGTSVHQPVRRTMAGPVRAADGRPVFVLHWAGYRRPYPQMPLASWWAPHRLRAGDVTGALLGAWRQRRPPEDAGRPGLPASRAARVRRLGHRR